MLLLFQQLDFILYYCSEKRKSFFQFLNIFRKDKSAANRKNMVKARTEYKNAVRKFTFERDRQKSFKLLNAKVKNAKDYWKLLKSSISQPKSKNISIDVFENYFRTVNNPEDRFFQPDEDILFFNERFLNSETQIMFDELNVNITVEEIRKAIGQLKNGRSGGPDKFLNEFFVHGSNTLLSYLYSLFNKILNIGYFPESWSEGFIVPLHKKGKLDDVNNFRGITFLSIVGKLFSRILNNRLTEWAEEYYVYIEAQAGFRESMSTIDNLFVLHGLISHTINTGEKLFCAFVDFTKAFDYVVRDILWYKLIKLGVRGKILNVVMSMYKQIKSRVKLDCNISTGFSCELGVRQGECLSPFLFAMYLNDLEDEFYLKGSTGIDIGMLKIFLLLYADDIVIFSNTAQELQRNLDILSEYCLRNRLVVNTIKTKIMIFRTGGILPRDMKFYYNNIELEIVSKFSYLGMVFTTGGSFSACQETLAGQGMKAIYKLNRLLYNFTNITPKHRLELFDKLVTPVLNYGSEIWGFCQAKQIERTHMMFCKQLLGVKTSTQNDFIYGEFGRIDYYSRRLYIIIKYWFKILQASDRKNTKVIYRLMLNDIDERPNAKNWAAFVKNTLSNLGFFHVWEAQGVGDVNNFLSVFKQRVKDHFIQSWHERLNKSSRASFYREICVFEFQPYLEKVVNKKFRNALSKIRLSSHRLHIESGRWKRPHSTPRENRVCFHCNILEDEFHFIFECSLYDDERCLFIKPYFRRSYSMFKLIELFQSSNKGTLNKLGNYTHKCFEKRTELFLRRK